MRDVSCGVLVVGAGPVGSFAARRIAEKGYKVVLAEEHEKIGEPTHCTGLVTPRALDIADIGSARNEIIQSEIRGANIHAPDTRAVLALRDDGKARVSGTALQIRGKNAEAYAIDRPAFDRLMCGRAGDAGAVVMTGTRISDVVRKDGSVLAAAKHGGSKFSVNAKIVIGADGAFSAVRRSAMLEEPKELLYGFQAEFENVDMDERNVEIFVGNGVAPGFFAWAVPAGGRARIGLCTTSRKSGAGTIRHKAVSSQSAADYFGRLLELPKVAEITKGAKIVRKMAGVVPLGAPKKTYADNIMVVGDAAAQVKPTSGGGIYTGLVCAEKCAAAALNALEQGDFSEKILSKYQRDWTKAIGRELQIGMHLRSAFRRMPDGTINRIFRKLDDPGILEILSEYGDIDYPSRAAFELLKRRPGMLAFVPRLISML